MSIQKVLVHPLSLLNISEHQFRQTIAKDTFNVNVTPRGILFGVVKNRECSVVISRELNNPSKDELLTLLDILKQVYGYLNIVGFYTVNDNIIDMDKSVVSWLEEVQGWLENTQYILDPDSVVYLVIDRRYSDLKGYNIKTLKPIPRKKNVGAGDSNNGILTKAQDNITFSLEELALKLDDIISFLERVEKGSIRLYESDQKMYQDLQEIRHFMDEMKRAKRYNQNKEGNNILNLISISEAFIFDCVKKIDALTSKSKDL
ncbi:hypothetical protein HII13_004698 [Brettanomyces bruxellensis]|nr:hypothetical protein HII13_004698 [Brettanomyces bruxellensis]